MRFRLGLLQDTAAIEKQIARDAEAARKPPTVKTEAQTKMDEARAKEPEKKSKPKIRPLSEAKAIELGANFVSESFLLGVAIALVLFENARRGRQETKKGEDVQDKLDEMTRKYQAVRKGMIDMEKEVIKSRSKDSSASIGNRRILPDELRAAEDVDDESQSRSKGWLPWLTQVFRKDKADTERSMSAAQPEPTDANEAHKSGNTTTIAMETSALKKLLPRSYTQDISPQATSESSNSSTSEARDPSTEKVASSDEVGSHGVSTPRRVQ